jgi:hypothetical protein
MKSILKNSFPFAIARRSTTTDRRQKNRLGPSLFTTFALALFLLTGLACQKGEVGPKEFGSGPRKPVPAEMVGDWMYTTVSGTNVVSPNGHTVPAWAFGSMFHINADGTGYSIVTASTNTYTSEDTQRIEENGTYEIEVDGGDLVFRFYPANGKVYNNDVFAHDLVDEKLYPNTFVNWTAELGTNSSGRYFTSGDLIYYKSK